MSGSADEISFLDGRMSRMRSEREDVTVIIPVSLAPSLGETEAPTRMNGIIREYFLDGGCTIARTRQYDTTKRRDDGRTFSCHEMGSLTISLIVHFLKSFNPNLFSNVS